VWYAAYGSNLSRTRFSCYLRGGTPPGALRTYPGCRDTTAPLAESAITMAHRLFFAGHSTVWNGAVAFVETSVDPRAVTHARLYLITSSQLEDVHDQDNRSGRRCRLDLARLQDERIVVAGDGWYDTFLHVGVHLGHPVVTFTTSDRAASVGELAPPSDQYRATMALGLAESHGLTPPEAARYLDAAADPAAHPRHADTV